MAKSSVIDQFIEKTSTAVDGVLALTIVDVASGMSLGTFSTGQIDPDLASAANVEVVKAKRKAISALGLKENIDDILITLDTQYHIIAITNNGDHMIYLAADKKKANLALARNVLRKGVNEIQDSL
jgi:predicted regulator of Ras-like GTPase activity (Roadblock/LC7/MglB family)